jgi:hypothetical protein
MRTNCRRNDAVVTRGTFSAASEAVELTAQRISAKSAPEALGDMNAARQAIREACAWLSARVEKIKGPNWRDNL